MTAFLDSAKVRQKLEPLAPEAAADFPWDEIHHRVDGEPVRDVEPDQAATALREIMAWAVSVDLKSRHAQVSIARRVIAIAWVTNPELFEGAPSLTQLAKRLRIPVSRLAEQSAEVTKRFGISNRYQTHSLNRKERQP